jgi:hypothetical protein
MPNWNIGQLKQGFGIFLEITLVTTDHPMKKLKCSNRYVFSVRFGKCDIRIAKNMKIRLHYQASKVLRKYT